MAENYEVKITTQGDPKGADKVAESLNKVAKSTADAGKESKESARNLNELGEATEKGARVGQVFGQVLNGNIGAITQLGSALKATGAAFRTNFIGIALIGASALVEFLQNVRSKTNEAGQAANTAAESLGEAAAAADRLNKIRLDQFAAALEIINQRSAATLAFFDKLQAASQMLDDARMSVELAQNSADSSLSPEQRSAREFEIRDRFKKQRERREDQSRAERVAEAEATAKEKGALVDSSDSALGTQRGVVSAAALALANRNRLAANVEEDQAAVRMYAALEMNGALSPSVAKKAQEANDRLAENTAALSRLPSLDRLTQDVVSSIGALDGFVAELKRATKEAEEAQRSFENMRQSADVDNNTLPIARGLTTQAARIAAGVPEPESKIDTSRRVEKFNTPPSAVVFDGATVQALAKEQGRTTGEVIARLFKDAMITNNEEIIQQTERMLKAQRR